jgi:hypothetical protein
MNVLDISISLLLVGAIAFVAGRKTAPTGPVTNNQTRNQTDVTINLPADSDQLEKLDLDHPAIAAATVLPLAKAKVWLKAYQLACDSGHTPYPEDEADRAVKAAFD